MDGGDQIKGAVQTVSLKAVPRHDGKRSPGSAHLNLLHCKKPADELVCRTAADRQRKVAIVRSAPASQEIPLHTSRRQKK